jgi:hypothetical protein
MIIAFINSIILNPLFLFTRMWYSLYLPLVNIFELSVINHNTTAHSNLLTFILSSTLSLLSPFGIFILFNSHYADSPFFIRLGEYMFNIMISYFVVDIILGYQYYRKILYKDVLTFSVHHIVYIIALIYVKYLNVLPLCISLLPLEIPTVILSLGHIDKYYKSPILFGTLFFLFRIVYNILVIWKMYSLCNFIGIFSTMILCIHIYWFRIYVNKYILKKT